MLKESQCSASNFHSGLWDQSKTSLENAAFLKEKKKWSSKFRRYPQEVDSKGESLGAGEENSVWDPREDSDRQEEEVRGFCYSEEGRGSIRMSDDSVSVLKEMGWQQNIWISKGESKKTVASAYGRKICKRLRDAWSLGGLVPAGWGLSRQWSGEPCHFSRGKVSPARGQMGKAAGPKQAMLSQHKMEGIKLDKWQQPAVLKKREQMSWQAIDLTMGWQQWIVWPGTARYYEAHEDQEKEAPSHCHHLHIISFFLYLAAIG